MICLKISGSDIWNFVQRHMAAHCNGHRRSAVKSSAPMDAVCWGCPPSPCSSLPWGRQTLPLTFWYSHDLSWIRLFWLLGAIKLSG